MKSLLTSLAAGIALVLASTTARADFQTWKNKDGKAAELEITGVDEGAAGTQVRFRTKADKEVILKLDDLAADDQTRVKAWNPASPLKATFAYVKKRPNAQSPHIQFVFDLKPGIALPSHPAKLSNIKATVGGKELEVREWLSLVDDGMFSWDPFSEGPPPTKREWTLVITAEGDVGNVAVEDCEFSADVEVSCGKSPKEISALFPLPKSASSEDDVEKTVEPIGMKLESMEAPDFKSAGRKGKKGGDMPNVLTGYSLMAGKSSKGENGASILDSSPIIHRAFVVNGKEYLNTIDKDRATDPIKVVVKYWSETYNAPLRLTKAASNKGRKPPTDTEDSAPDGGKGGGGGGGGNDPFEE